MAKAHSFPHMEAAFFSNHHGLLRMKSFLIVILAFTCQISTGSAARRSPITTHSSVEFIRTSCRATSYPTLCFSSLSTHASLIQTSPKLLAHAALNVTLATAKATSVAMLQLSKTHGLRPKEVDAMSDCVEELSDAVDELIKSIEEMGQMRRSRSRSSSKDFGLMVNDVQTWVSAALTDENTCTDGFQGNAMNGKMKVEVRGKIVTIAQLTSNALALINRFASLSG